MEFLAIVVKVAKFLTLEKLPKWTLIWLWSRAGFLRPPATSSQPPGQRLKKPKWMLLFPHTNTHSPSFTKQDSCIRGLHAKFLPVPPNQACPSHVHRGLDLQNQPKTGSQHYSKLCRPTVYTCPALAMLSVTGALKGVGYQICSGDVRNCIPTTQLGG